MMPLHLIIKLIMNTGARLQLSTEQVTEQRKIAVWICELAKGQSFVNTYAVSFLLYVYSKNSLNFEQKCV